MSPHSANTKVSKLLKSDANLSSAERAWAYATAEGGTFWAPIRAAGRLQGAEQLIGLRITSMNFAIAILLNCCIHLWALLVLFRLLGLPAPYIDLCKIDP